MKHKTKGKEGQGKGAESGEFPPPPSAPRPAPTLPPVRFAPLPSAPVLLGKDMTGATPELKKNKNSSTNKNSA